MLYQLEYYYEVLNVEYLFLLFLEHGMTLPEQPLNCQGRF